MCGSTFLPRACVVLFALICSEAMAGKAEVFDKPEQWFVGDHEPIPASTIVNGEINPHRVGGGRKLYLMYTREQLDDFTLECDFKLSTGCNSGIFLRTGDPLDPVQTGLEIQIFDSAGKANVDKYDCGALYDAYPPSTNAAKPAGEWNHIKIEANGTYIKVVLNDQPVLSVDLNEWKQPGRNPDGSKNKYAKALKDFPRKGYVGLQDHNRDVWYRNVKIEPLGGR